jgi:hypothetical protein
VNTTPLPVIVTAAVAMAVAQPLTARTPHRPRLLALPRRITSRARDAIAVAQLIAYNWRAVPEFARYADTPRDPEKPDHEANVS